MFVLRFKYFGLQFARTCFCGNDYGKHGEKPVTECNMGCTGNADEKCGGSWRNAIYSTGLGMSTLRLCNNSISK